MHTNYVKLYFEILERKREHSRKDIAGILAIDTSTLSNIIGGYRKLPRHQELPFFNAVYDDFNKSVQKKIAKRMLARKQANQSENDYIDNMICRVEI